VFSWNTKQLFVFLTAEYETPSVKLNQVVLWDRIIEDKANATLALVGADQEYRWTAWWTELKEDTLRNARVKLKLSWDAMPLAGGRMITYGGGPVHEFRLPQEYFPAPRAPPKAA
jgi:signal peptidase complex subunit 3